ncbi:MAG: PAS domain S-box protein [Gemmatimonadaceae bacterium]|nr:PAS domain S-box protein [Gemmatimonadaceae bacterium]
MRRPRVAPHPTVMLEIATPAGVMLRFLRWRLLLVIGGSLLGVVLAPAAARALPLAVHAVWGAWLLTAVALHFVIRRDDDRRRRQAQYLIAFADAPVLALITASAGLAPWLTAPLLAVNLAATAGRLSPRAGTALLVLTEASLVCAWLPTLLAPTPPSGALAGLVLQGGALTVLALFQAMATRVARSSRAQWERLFDAVPDMIFVLDRKAEVLLANRAAERTTGYDQATLRGGRLARFVPEELREAAIAQMNRTLAGESMLYEAIGVRADGRRFPVRMATVPLLEGEAVAGILVVAHDLTAERRDAQERERMAQALEANRRVLEGIVRTQASGLYLFDVRERRAVFMNEAMQELLGIDAEQLALLAPADRRARIHPDDRALVRDAIGQAVGLDDETRIEVEYRLRDRHGRWRWVTDRLGVFERDAQGAPVTLVGSGIDITERKASVEALRRSEQRYRALIEHFPAGSVLLFDDTLRITLADGQGLREQGLTPADIVGQDVGAFLDASQASIARVAAAAALGGEEQRYDVAIAGRQYETQVVPIRDPDGTVRAGMALAVDVTERKKVEAERRQRLKMEAVGTLAGGIAHDFNNILASIMGYAELIAMETRDERVREDIGEVLVAAGRGRELVQRILAFSRSGSEEHRPVALAPIVDEAVRLLRPTLPRGVEVAVHVEDALPTVLGDPLELHQVVVNLCGNALHAMRTGGGSLDLALRRVEAHGGPHVRLMVRDAGTGMPPDVLERAFDPFFTTKAPGEGSGMGLAMVHGIVTSMGGRIMLDSVPGGGTTATVDLPAASGRAGPDAVRAEPPMLPGGHERILVVDDEPAVARFLAGALARLGYEVEVLTDPEAAVTRLAAPDPGTDLLLTDMTMPRLSGEQLLVAVRAAHPLLPVLLCTGWSASMTPDRALELGAASLLPKPVTVERLAVAVRAALDRRAVPA